MEYGSRENEITHQVHYLEGQIPNMITQFESIQNQLVDVMTDIHHGKINPLIIKPTQLKKEIKLIKLVLQLRGEASIDYIYGIGELYKVMTMTCRVFEDKIVLRLTIPMTDLYTFNLLRVIPIPIIKRARFQFIDSHPTYVAVNVDKNEYVELSDADITRGIELHNNPLLCTLKTPKYVLNTSMSCVMNNYVNKSLDRCHGINTTPVTEFIQLQRNTWLYYTNDTSQIKIECRNHMYEFPKESIGIVQMKDMCIIRTPQLIIHSYGTHNTMMNSKIMNLTLNESQYIQHIKLSHPIHLHDNLENSIANITLQLENVKQHQFLSNLLDAHHLSVIYLGIIIIFVLMCQILQSTRNQAPSLLSLIYPSHIPEQKERKPNHRTVSI